MGACLRAEHPVGGAAHRGRATVEDVRVDQRRDDIAVPEEFLNPADVVPVFEKVGRERVPEGVPDGQSLEAGGGRSRSAIRVRPTDHAANFTLTDTPAFEHRPTR